MTGPELHFITVADASRRITRRELSPVELTEAYLQRIAAVDDQLQKLCHADRRPCPAAGEGGRGRDHARRPARPATRYPLLSQGHRRDGRDPDHGTIEAA